MDELFIIMKRKNNTLNALNDDKIPAASNKEEHICKAIYNAIMEHRLPPGTKLTEAAFSEFFGASRSIIRKSFFRLAQRNIIELRLNRGAMVASPGIEETREVFQARRIIESEIIRIVSGNISKEQLKRLKSLAKQEQKAQAQNDRHALVRLSGDIHLLLADISGNRVLKKFMNELVSRTSLIIALYEAPGARTCATHDHWELIDLIANKDARAAGKAMKDHLYEIENRLNLVKNDAAIDLGDVFGAG